MKIASLFNIIFHFFFRLFNILYGKYNMHEKKIIEYNESKKTIINRFY